MTSSVSSFGHELYMNVGPRRQNDPIAPQANWWTTSGGSIFIPSGTEPISDTSSLSEPSSTHVTTSFHETMSFSDQASSETTRSAGNFLTTFTSSEFTTITQQSTTFTSFSQSIVTSPITTAVFTSSSRNHPATTLAQSASAVAGQLSTREPVCVGNGLDSLSDGLMASLVLPSAIGFILWLLFAILRPRFRQIYALREWFVQQGLRPRPLGNGFFAFLFPPVPLVPSVPSKVTDVGRSAVEDAKIFPSDEQLSQRTLWVSFLIVLGWSILGLGGALPLYLVNIPCLADQPSPAVFGGFYSPLQDLSLARLLRAVDTGNISTNNLAVLLKRANDDPQNFRARIIVLTILTLVLALLPALHKILKEFNRLVAYRRCWIETKCEGKEMGWLGARDAPGFVGWGEKRLKDFILKTGLSSSLDKNGSPNRGPGRDFTRGPSSRTRSRREEREPLKDTETAQLEVDVQNLFSISDTHHIALLIEERDEVLENLEIAETRYINSFRLSTPDPSIADFQPTIPQDPNRPYISRPKPLANSTRRRRSRRSKNPAFAASSLAPTSFVAPSQYYRLRGVSGVNGGRFTDSMYEKEPSFSDSFHSRITGTRFQELDRGSQYGQLPLGSQVVGNEDSHLKPVEDLRSASSLQFPDPRLYGPNHGLEASDQTDPNLESLPTLEEEAEWIDLSHEATPDIESADNGYPSSPGPSSFKRRIARLDPSSSSRRETFPFRNKGETDVDDVPPPHLRLQPSQPFVRPMDGIDYNDLGVVYNDITQWRTKLKTINAEIVDAQRDSYSDIADGARIKGWLLVGRGLHFIPGVQLIEGRAKEDIRWDVLQNERAPVDSFAMWICIALAAITLAAGITAACGLSLATAPDVFHFLPFLQPLLNDSTLDSGIATIFIPALAIILFLFLAIAFVHWVSDVRGTVSISGGQLLLFKTTFYFMTVVSALVMMTVGALLFAMQAFNTGTAPAKSVASGSIYMTALALTIIIQMAVIFPGLLLLQPVRLWRVLRAEKHAVTPRQRFRAVYPGTYDPSFALGSCVLAIVFASTFSLIFPLIGPAVVILLFLTLIAHRFLIGYVYARTHSQTGGLLQIWLLRRLATLTSFQPILLGLIFLSREFWIEGGVLAGTGVLVIGCVEAYTGWKTRLPGRNTLSAITKNSLDTFEDAARTSRRGNVDGESMSLVSSAPGARTRGSMASVLEMMSLTLAVMPSPSPTRGAVPLQTETLDDLIATERAARTHPDAPPHLPPLPFADHAEEMAGILYAPELIAPPPIIWLPNDPAGVARSEAVDLQKYHDLRVTLDIRTREQVSSMRRSASLRNPS